jgi:hypothetical protein
MPTSEYIDLTSKFADQGMVGKNERREKTSLALYSSSVHL